MRLPRLFLALTLTLLALTGCQTNFHLSTITVSIVELRPAAAAENQVVLKLRFFSANVVAVAVEDTTHKLYLNGTYVGRSVNPKAIGLPALGSVDQEVTLDLENRAVVTQILQAADRRPVAYSLESRLNIQVEDSYEYYHTTQKGTVDLSALAP